MTTTQAQQPSFWNRNWFWILIIALVIIFGLPFLAPVFMALGWDGAGRVIYTVYSFLCHQLPQRSYFLFGPHFTYSLAQIQASSGVTDPNNLLALRRFVGNPELGWKVAWSDRMVWMYTSIPLFALLWYPLRRRIKALPWWGFILLLLPMAFDGGTHFISDLSGIGHGFRDMNLWLAALTNNTFPPTFYTGDAWGSFNSLMRLLTGVLFGMGIVWFGFPFLEDAVQ